jgi:hypothetical protein
MEPMKIVGSFCFVFACAASQSTTNAVPPMQPAPIVSCPPTYAEASLHTLHCDTEPHLCRYTEGTCECVNVDNDTTRPQDFVCKPSSP